ncbi:MAG: glycosyltransferase family 39 protein [Pirellulales bacterium]
MAPARICIALILCLSALLCGWSAWKHAPTELETSQLPAGLCHLQLGRFDLCHINPPLVRMVAALPVWAASPAVNWQYHPRPIYRAERAVGANFLQLNGKRAFWLFFVARLACIPFLVIGGYACAAWARDLYGNASSIVAAVLWCFSPFVLGYGSLMSSDAHSAGMAVFAAYSFWRWLKEPNLVWTLCTGAMTGLALLTKFTLLVLIAVYVVLWVLYFIIYSEKTRRCGAWRSFQMLILIGIVAGAIVNLGYGFEGSFTRIGDFAFESKAFSGLDPERSSRNEGGNLFADSGFRNFPVPLPRNYVLGIDLAKWDLERGWLSYLRGEWKRGGWWYFYLYALAIKTPIGVLLLFWLTMYLTFFSVGYSSEWRDEVALVLPALSTLLLVSCQTGISFHSRYMLPALPFAFIWISKSARSFNMKHVRLSALVAAAIGSSTYSSLAIFPHNLSYFNELVGGPRNGYKHLLDSNLSWGQDLFLLSRWLKEHPEAAPIKFASYGPVDPRLAGIQFSLPPPSPNTIGWGVGPTDVQLGPHPGWFAVDVNYIAGANSPLYDGLQSGRQFGITSERFDFSYFQRFKPVAFVGYSIRIYDLRLDDVNAVRHDLGLTALRSGDELR